MDFVTVTSCFWITGTPFIVQVSTVLLRLYLYMKVKKKTTTNNIPISLYACTCTSTYTVESSDSSINTRYMRPPL